MPNYSEKQMLDLLKRAQYTYGYQNQISVSVEECCELAQVLSKYVRYPDHDTASNKLRDSIIDEVADVAICLNHVTTIFDIKPEELKQRTDKKLARLEGWLNKSTDIHQTTKDRGV